MSTLLKALSSGSASDAAAAVADDATESAGRRPALSTALCLAALAALTAALVGTFTGGGTLGHRGPLLLWYPLDCALFALALLALRQVPARRVAALVLVGSAAVAAAALLVAPRTSDDAYRYLWDGHVQAAGISPYAYPPDAPQLAHLRAEEPTLFPTGGACTAWDERLTAAGQCTHINRPAVPTIYPPVAQAWFLVLHLVEHGSGVRAAQAGGALLAVVTTGVLLVVLPRERRRRAALWGWFPGTAVWAVNDAHVDALGALLTVAGLALAVRHRRVAGGVALGGAIATKLLPALALPGALSGVLARRPTRRDLLVPAVAVGFFVLAYVPYLILSGRQVIGFLPGYLHEEGYDDGTAARFGLLQFLPGWAAAPVAALLVLAAALYVMRRGDPDRPWAGALLVYGTLLLALTPDYPWYGLLLVALVAMDGRWEWLGVPAAGEAVYLIGGDAQVAAYSAALGLVLVGAAIRWRHAVARRPVVPEPRETT
ncbi:glycosyltransferase 87 family protein [Streptacidiphilus fuscans]|uniref:glycosyltransferase 87 family protein n=1 Tax=Streptacidiphilus fuscans TaxID=2789292 RepID=UPI001C06B5A7|nr:glycosyltransferase 87 family protein [Streptacidiphilus fuscans]